MVFAQESATMPSGTGNKSFFAELGGPGILFSANFDTRFTKSHLGFGGRIGLGFVSGYSEETYIDSNGYYYSNGKDFSIATIPLQVNYVFGKPNSVHCFEVGAGITILGRKVSVLDFYDDRRSTIFGSASFMYRRSPKDGGFSWRIGFTPLISKGYIQPFGAVSVGYNF